MGKGSGACQRPGISLEASDSAKTESTLSGRVASVSEINTTLELQRLESRWFTKGDQVVFQKRKEGWIVDAYPDSVRKAFKEYGLIHQQASTSSYEYAYFPSLKAARQAANDVSLEAELNIDSRLTKGKSISYKIGDLPLFIRKDQGHWRVYALIDELPQSLRNHFNSVEEFREWWNSTDIVLADYPTRKAARQAVINWLAQTIAEGQ